MTVPTIASNFVMLISL